MKIIKIAAISVIASAILAGCGGGGGSSSSPAPAPVASAAEGLWVGTTGDNRAITGLVFETGLFYVLYSSVGDPATIAGVVQGNGSTAGATFSSTNSKDFNMEGDGVLDAGVSANFAAKATFNGTITYGPGLNNTFTSAYDSDYELTPTTSALAGTFTGEVASSAGNEAATITIASNGSFSGSGVSGCTVSGTATPRTRGNAFVMSLTFGSAPCLFASQTLSGIGYFDAANKRFYSATPNASRTDGILFVGVKP